VADVIDDELENRRFNAVRQEAFTRPSTTKTP
jgi:hypothetical protein